MTNELRLAIRLFRIYRNVTPKQLGQKLKLSRGAISKIEVGPSTLTPERLQMVAEGLDTTPAVLYMIADRIDCSRPKSIKNFMAIQQTDEDYNEIMRRHRKEAAEDRERYKNRNIGRNRYRAKGA